MSVIDPKTNEIIFNRDLHAEKLAESEEDELDAEQQEELNKAIELYKLHGMLFLDDEDGKNAYEVLYNAGYTLKKSGDVASCIELNKLVESADNEYKKWCVVRVGGSIGEGRYKIVSSFDDKEEAKEDAKDFRKLLSPGEKKYYRMTYTVIDRDHPGRFVGLFKQPVKEDFDEDLFEAIIDYANEQGVDTTDLFEGDYEAIADYVSEKLGRPVSAATVEEAIVMDYDDSMDLDEELEYKYDDEISTFKPGSIQYKKLEQAAKMIQDRLGIIVKVDDTWFDYGQKWMWTTLLGEDPDGIIYGDSSAWQLIYPPQQKEIIFGDLDKAVDDICKHYEKRIAENSNKSSDVNESSDNSASSAVRSNISIKDFNKLVEDLNI